MVREVEGGVTVRCQDGDILHHWQRLPWERWIIRHHFNYVLSGNENSQDLMLLSYCSTKHQILDLIDICVSGWNKDTEVSKEQTECWKKQRKIELWSKCDDVVRKKMTWSQSTHKLTQNSNNFVRVNVQNSSWRPPGPPGKRKTGSGNRIWRVLMTSVLCWQLLASLPNSVVCESSETGRFQSLE